MENEIKIKISDMVSVNLKLPSEMDAGQFFIVLEQAKAITKASNYHNEVSEIRRVKKGRRSQYTEEEEINFVKMYLAGQYKELCQKMGVGKVQEARNKIYYWRDRKYANRSW